MEKIVFSKVKEVNGWLGNMSPFPIQFEGETWRTSEALFQALRFENKEIRELIRSQKSPMAAKMKSKLHKNEMIILPMSKEDCANMRFVIQLKIKQHAEIQRMLVNTSNKIIIENIGSRSGERHFFWGAKWIDTQWVGNNQLGKIWMELRATIG